MGGVSGVYAAKVVVLGAGVSGMNAAAIALGMQAEVLLLDKNVARLRGADAIYQGHLQTVASNDYEVERAVLDADLVIGAVLVPGAKAPMLVSNELVSRMKPGSVLVDISIDRGGCFEDSRPTTHADPAYKVHGSVLGGKRGVSADVLEDQRRLGVGDVDVGGQALDEAPQRLGGRRRDVQQEVVLAGQEEDIEHLGQARHPRDE
jgi:threonine dehydrogenase-like Zn-dependent dehydrogenase